MVSIYGGNPSLVPITKKFIKYGQNAYKHYDNYLEKLKLQSKEKQEQNEKLKKELEKRVKIALKSKDKLVNLEERLKEKKNILKNQRKQLNN